MDLTSVKDSIMSFGSRIYSTQPAKATQTIMTPSGRSQASMCETRFSRTCDIIVLKRTFSEGQEQAVSTLCSAVLRDQNGELPSPVSYYIPQNGSCSGTDRNADIDEKNMSFAKRNILQNNLKSRIRPLLTKPNDPLIPLDAFGLER